MKQIFNNLWISSFVMRRTDLFRYQEARKVRIPSSVFLVRTAASNFRLFLNTSIRHPKMNGVACAQLAFKCYKHTSIASRKTAVTPLLTHWSYCNLALRCNISVSPFFNSNYHNRRSPSQFCDRTHSHAARWRQRWLTAIVIELTTPDNTMSLIPSTAN